MRRPSPLVPGLLLITVFGCQAGRDESGAIETAGEQSVFTIRVGDCFDDHEPGEVTEVDALPCTDPHDNQVFATFDLPDGAWIGDDAVTEAGQEGCSARFEAAIGSSYEDSVLEFYPMTPTQASWENGDDREIVCVAYHMNLNKLSVNALGSGM